ncbi:MAG TPA: MATE family efflux transporter [Candidatus Ornithomonoglobus intestinigallinarum]|uniref:Multidrug export protein MepA n=1 Tax=Candidatus Ornithomonoglobus intestinigallinarum TaxID=2840894 RepID=A0A9D1H396_9FIRM|nr:MATE family efflux transporter [Candidatus Ornithomonoglobus intestinigallinarum]
MDNTELGTGKIGQLVVKLAIPTMLAQLVNLLYNIVDRIYVGRIPEVGSLALAGLGVTFPIIMLVAAFAALAGNGGASRAAIAMGAGDIKKAERILGNSASLLVIFSAVLTVVFLIVKDPILLMFGASENTLPYASEYITIYLIGTVFVQLSLGLNAFITNQGFTKTSMATVCIGAALNIILDPVFIFVFDMGVKGAALATILSQAVSCVWVVAFFRGKRTVLKLRRHNFRLERKTAAAILSLGVSPFIMQLTECLVQLTFNNGMLKYGNDMYVALMSILFSMLQVVWMPISGLSQGVQPIIGYNYGARKLDRVKKAFKLMFMANLGFSLVVVGFVELFPQAFISMFTGDAAIIEIGTPAVRVYMAGMALMGAQSACQNTFIALGEAKISLFLAFLRKIILILPLALILPLIGGLGVWGLFLAEPISDVIAVAVTTTMFAVSSRRLLKE